MIPTVLPGVRAVNAVDASGVHPLLLAIGSERYVPYAETSQPQELLTQANAILGQGQMSLAKYLWIIDEAAAQDIDVNDIGDFFVKVLQRVDWTRDLHFQTRTTIDTLDYSGTGFNEGSKLVVAAAGPPIRKLATTIPESWQTSELLRRAEIVLPGIVAISGAKWTTGDHERDLDQLVQRLRNAEQVDGFPLVLFVDDAEFCAASLNNFLWVTFTRSNPATDVSGVDVSIVNKHWGCHGSLIIDARIKPHHAPPLIEDLDASRRVDAIATRGGVLAKYL